MFRAHEKPPRVAGQPRGARDRQLEEVSKESMATPLAPDPISLRWEDNLPGQETPGVLIKPGAICV